MPDRPAPRSPPHAARPRRARGALDTPDAAAPGPQDLDAERPNTARVGPRESALHTLEYRAMLTALQRARIDAALTLEEVAARLKRPVSYVWKSEHGERRVDAIELWRFAGLYGRAVTDFLPDHRFQPDP